MELEEDSLILGTVDKIEHMNVFVKLPDGKTGTIVNSEIAPGRIKNLRAYVAPNKVVVCKILRISNNHIDLSLRRVTAREKKEVLMKHQQERDIEIGLKSILKENSKEIIEKLKKDFNSLPEFIEKVQQEKQILKQYFPKDSLEQIEKLTERKKKEVEVRKTIKLKCFESNGIEKIREIFNLKKEKVRVIYVSAGNYLLSVKAEDYKVANHLMQELVETIEKQSKKANCEISIEEKK